MPLFPLPPWQAYQADALQSLGHYDEANQIAAQLAEDGEIDYRLYWSLKRLFLQAGKCKLNVKQSF